MQPVVRGHTANADMPATQNFLPNKRDHDGVINVVVDSVAGRDSFESKLRSSASRLSQQEVFNTKLDGSISELFSA
jgi:hypothetical protein